MTLFNLTRHIIMINVIFEGHLGADAEVRTSQNGFQFYSMNVATKEYSKGVKGTTWVRVNYPVERARNMKLGKGSHVLVIGQLSVSQYVNKLGETAVGIDVFADRITYAGGSGILQTQDGQGGYRQDNRYEQQQQGIPTQVFDVQKPTPLEMPNPQTHQVGEAVAAQVGVANTQSPLVEMPNAQASQPISQPIPQMAVSAASTVDDADDLPF